MKTEPKQLRRDVATFAAMMAAVMDAKDAEKGTVTNPDLATALNSLGFQFGRFQEIGIFRDKEEMRRILIHIANFAMIAHLALGE